ncbi:NtaA/DmoA family FMN-dependent monooxygenase [Micrococcus endophyticus]|uniref:FMN-dependent oxidoreductase (Nitrilotriacetate monooxygenase family) n=1 Tax=Micrococcus endophyticus TaxID=455343 RepID=A0A7W9N1G0_9MICC|nr:NtaA/DmoA family FMN-dependent monooxygenase [Micrococcus endophyticus]MBB5849151.1 FMN-dependent oxidoreductase (nitrilotriacetate monooxygenase family) [Micrococcus endophyticus]
MTAPDGAAAPDVAPAPDGASTPFLLSAFEMMTPVHQSPGLWRHPESRIAEFDRLAYWTRLARTVEDGGFSALFLADVLGLYDVYGGGIEATVRGGVQWPVLDPAVAVPAMAAATERIGFGVTASVTYERPYLLARTLATLDHFTGGRVAWNIVTSYQDSAARNLGLDRQIPHDARYDLADEALHALYRLWEGSVEPGAVRFDRAAGVVADPDRVHPAAVAGAHVRVPDAALTHPGPQGTPYLFQAGASARGRRFALDHAEAVFAIGPTPAHVRRFVDQTRAGLTEAGRSADAIRVLAMVTVVVAETDEAAAQRLAGYAEHVDVAGALALWGGWTGVDVAGLDPDAPLEHVVTDANRSALAAFTEDPSGRTWTLRDVAEFVAIGGRGPVIVGSPETVADELQRWQAETGVDGFNVSAAVRPADLERFAALVSPELRRRGVLREPEPGRTLRENLSGAGPALPADHRGHAFRTAG